MSPLAWNFCDLQSLCISVVKSMKVVFVLIMLLPMQFTGNSEATIDFLLFLLGCISCLLDLCLKVYSMLLQSVCM